MLEMLQSQESCRAHSGKQWFRVLNNIDWEVFRCKQDCHMQRNGKDRSLVDRAGNTEDQSDRYRPCVWLRFGNGRELKESFPLFLMT